MEEVTSNSMCDLKFEPQLKIKYTKIIIFLNRRKMNNKQEHEKIRKKSIELASLFKLGPHAKKLRKLTKEQAEMVKKLTLSVEIHPNFGGLFPASSEPSVTCLEFLSKDDPTTVFATKLREGIVLAKNGEFEYKKKQKNPDKEFFLDIAPGKNCFFIFCHHAGIYKKLLDDSRPRRIYRFK